MARRTVGAAAESLEAERARLIGKLEDWVEDTELEVAPQLALRLTIRLDGDDAALLNRAAELLDRDYDEILRQALRDYARALLEREGKTQQTRSRSRKPLTSRGDAGAAASVQERS